MGAMGGLAATFVGAVDLAQGGGSGWLIPCGLGVAVLGVAAFFLSLWTARRRL